MLALDEELRTKEWMMELARRFVAHDFSRHGAISWLDQRLFCWPGLILFSDGKQLKLRADDENPFSPKPGTIQQAYGVDTSYAWNTNIKVFADRPMMRNPNWALLPRLRLWDAAFKIDADPIILPVE